MTENKTDTGLELFNSSETSEQIIEILKNKLKLDKDIVGLLVNSRGSIKNKMFFKKVIEQINGI